MINVLFLDHAPLIGGAQLVLLTYLKYLNTTNIKIYIVTDKKSEGYIKMLNNYQHEVIALEFPQLKGNPKALLGFIKSLLNVIRLIKKENINVVIPNTERTMYPATIASLILRRKLIWIIRDYCYNKTLFNILSYIPQKVLFVSKDIQRFYLGKNIKNKDTMSKYNVIYVGSDMDERITKISSEEKIAFQNKYHLKDKFVVGYVGRLAKWKGYQVLIEAMRLLNDPKIICLIAGDLESAEHDVKDIPENVLFTGFIKNPELIYKTLDVFIHPAPEPEPFATTLIESSMAKVPIIVTNLGGSKEIVKHLKTGILIEPNNPQLLADAINKLHLDSNLRNSIKESAYQNAIKRYRISEEVKKLEDFILND